MSDNAIVLKAENDTRMLREIFAAKERVNASQCEYIEVLERATGISSLSTEPDLHAPKQRERLESGDVFTGEHSAGDKVETRRFRDSTHTPEDCEEKAPFLQKYLDNQQHTVRLYEEIGKYFGIPTHYAYRIIKNHVEPNGNCIIIKGFKGKCDGIQSSIPFKEASDADVKMEAKRKILSKVFSS